MTWTIRQRAHDVGGAIVAEYECPIHGRFSRTVARTDSGDPPDVAPCTEAAAFLVVGHIGDGGDLLESVGPCGLSSPFRISAVRGRVKLGEVVRGRSDARPADKHVMNTEVLADGMPYDEFKTRRAAVHRDESLRRVRHAFGRTPKVYSGGK